MVIAAPNSVIAVNGARHWFGITDFAIVFTQVSTGRRKSTLEEKCNTGPSNFCQIHNKYSHRERDVTTRKNIDEWNQKKIRGESKAFIQILLQHTQIQLLLRNRKETYPKLRSFTPEKQNSHFKKKKREKKRNS